MDEDKYLRIAKKTRKGFQKELKGNAKRQAMGIYEQRIIEKVGGKVSLEEARKIDLEIFALYLKKCRARQGAKQFLRRVRKCGLKIFLVSNSNHYKLSHEIAATGMGEYFDGIVCSEKCGQEKSSGVPFSLAMEMAMKRGFAAKPSDFVMVGDREGEDGVARKLGVRAIIVGDKPGEFERVFRQVC